MSKFNIRMRLTDARDYTYLYSNSSAFTVKSVIGGICAVSDRMHAGIVLFQKRRNVCTRIYDLEQRIVICWRFALVRFGILSSVLAPSYECFSSSKSNSREYILESFSFDVAVDADSVADII